MISISKSRLRSRRGNAMLEFGLAALILIPLFLGTFQFGYTFYVYNLMNTQVRAAARYASLRSFRCRDNASIAKFKTAVANVVIYGNPAGTGTNLIPALTDTAKVDVEIKDAANNNADSTHVPTTVYVRITGFTLDAVVGSFTFGTKPVLIFPFQGQYLPAESE
jgi:Flp pilus assembly protein TadG